MRSPLLPGAVPKDHGAIGATEGPAWKNGSLYFTDGQHINRMGPDGKTSVFRHNASNGLLSTAKAVSWPVKPKPAASPEPRKTAPSPSWRIVIAKGASTRRMTSAWTPRAGFTSPIRAMGSREGMEILPPPSMKAGISKQPIEGVYRIESPGKITRILCDGAERPNGILISPDERFLYIADNNNNTHGGSRKLIRYELDANGDVKPGTRKVLFDWKDGRGPDGMKMDAEGRIYVVAGTNKTTPHETTRFKAGCSTHPARVVASSTLSPPARMRPVTALLAARTARRSSSPLAAICGACR